MIIVKLIGGLGNQMFQYAAGCALANLHKTELKLDKSLLEIDPKGAYTKRDPELGIFSLATAFATKEESELFLTNANSKVYREAYRRFPFIFKKLYIAENSKSYLKNFKKYGPNAYLDGFWQSEKYFEEVSDLIHKDFTFKNEPNEANREILEKIKNSKAVSLHVRRGDYISDKNNNSVHGTCSIEYYKQAVELLSKTSANLELFIFSDDIDWCKNNLNFNVPVHYVNHNKGKQSFEDMRLMSACKHNIIANSSFSWWGAWLNKNEKKQVISPKHWFRNESNPDIYPKNWIQL